MNPSPQEQLRCVVFLNNSAVTLLERNCYDQAHATILDAARILEGLGSDGASPSVSGVLLHERIQQSIHAANKRLAQPDDFNMRVPLLYMRGSSFLGPAAPIRMDEPEFHEVPEQLDVSLHCQFAIVTYNVAFSVFCLACLAETGDAAESLADTSIDLLQASYESLALFAGTWTPFHTSVAVNVLTALAKAFYAAGKSEDIEECVRSLESLHNSTGVVNGGRRRPQVACPLSAAAA